MAQPKTARKRPDNVERNKLFVTHGMSETSTYHIWRGILARCLRPTAKDYPRYGGRGITVCERWRKFENFVEDMGVRPPGMSIDRIDNSKGYAPENCRWATTQEQCNNKIGNRRLAFKGREQTVAQWAAELGMHRQTLRFRLESGWPIEDALTWKVDYSNGRKRNGL